MSVREQATMDIMEELEREHKAFVPFREKLNPLMSVLVSNHIRHQEDITPMAENPLLKSHSQLVAKCFFCKSDGSARVENYDHYYEKKNRN
jgi:hypothetical protein